MKSVFLFFSLILTMTLALSAEARPDNNRGGHGGWDRGHGHGGGHGGGYRPAPPPRYNPPRYVQPPHHGYNPGYNPGYNRRPVLRYPYRTLAWTALLGIFTYHQFQPPPPQMSWACFAQSNGYRGQGFGYNPQQAQENALISCGPACMDGSYEMNCSQRY